MSNEDTEQTMTETKPAPNPEKSIREQVTDILAELGFTAGEKTEKTEKKEKAPSLREIEALMEEKVSEAVTSVTAAAPVKKDEPHVQPEIAPGPAPRKKRISEALWG